MENTKSEFYEAVKCGREIEFSYKDKHYFESRHGDTDWYVYCEETKGKQHFISSDELLCNTILDGEDINDIWKDISIDYIL